MRRNWRNVELEIGEANRLRDFLRSKQILFETSGAYNLVHFEVRVSESEAQDVNEFLLGISK